MMLFDCLSCLSSTMGIFGYIFATFCSHTTAFSTQVQRKINPFNSIYTSTAGTEYPSLPVSHRCISLWRKSRQCVSAGYPLPSHKDHISVTLEWKYCCLGILHLDSSIFLQCFVHALLKRQTVLLSNKLQKQVENIQLFFLWWTSDWETYTFQLWAAPINYTSSPVVILLQMWVFPDTVIHVSTVSCLTKVPTKEGWWWYFPCHWTCWHPCAPGCQPRCDCSYIYSDVV